MNMSERKIYIQSAGYSVDFNWKGCDSCGKALSEPLPPHGWFGFLSIARAKENDAVCRVLCTDGTYCVVCRGVYVTHMRDLVNRPIYMNVCICNISEQEACAFETAYRKAVPAEGVHTWPEITSHYLQSGDDFDMAWGPLAEAVTEILQTPLDATVSLSQKLVYVEEVKTPQTTTAGKVLDVAIKAAVVTAISAVSYKIGQKIANLPVVKKVRKFLQNPID